MTKYPEVMYDIKYDDDGDTDEWTENEYHN